MATRRTIRMVVIRALLTVFVFLALLIGYAEYSHFQYHKEMGHKVNTLKVGQENLAAITEYQDKHFQNFGEFIPIEPGENLTHIENFKDCTENCTPCEYAVEASNQSFTATAKCKGKDRSPNFQGYVRVEPGQHKGIGGYYGKCKPEGVYAGKRFLVNTIGPCFEQDNGYMFIASGSKKRLVIETIPSNAEVAINGRVVGSTSESHNATTNSYGSLFISDPETATSFVTVSKGGYETRTFSIDWGSYTYKTTVVLNESTK